MHRTKEKRKRNEESLNNRTSAVGWTNENERMIAQGQWTNGNRTGYLRRMMDEEINKRIITTSTVSHVERTTKKRTFC